ncbi:MAG: sulfotransferase [Pseudomonadota bacterium]
MSPRAARHAGADASVQARGVSMAAALRQMEAGQYERALRILEQLCAKRPDSAITLKKIAQCNTALNRLVDAHQWWQRACDASPHDAQAWYGLGTCLQVLGRREQARAAFCRAVEADPTHADALICLFYADEKRQRHEDMDNWLSKLITHHPSHPIRHFLQALLLERRGALAQALRVMEEAPRPSEQEIFFPRWAHLFGRLLDEAGHCAAAFEAHASANSYHLRTSVGVQRKVDGYLAKAKRLLTGLAGEDYSHWAREEAPGEPQVVWQVGFPRSGTTLLDQVLDSHPNVTVVSEADTLSNIIAILDQLPGGYPACLDQLDDDLAVKLRPIYLSTLATYSGPPRDGHLYVDKNPLWTLHLPLLARLMPNAPVLDSRRHPADVCLSAFAQHFGLNEAMCCFLSMDSTVALYNTVMDCDERFARMLPFQRRQAVRYEDLVSDPEREARKVMAFLGLPWDPSVLDYHRHAAERGIQTASFDQAVKPIYTSAVGRWRRYATSLAPWLPALRHHAERLGYSVSNADSLVA